jgi:hypothetical protein
MSGQAYTDAANELSFAVTKLKECGQSLADIKEMVDEAWEDEVSLDNQPDPAFDEWRRAYLAEQHALLLAREASPE